MRARKKDANHKLVVDALRACGASVINLESEGIAGVVDLVVGYRGVTYLAEVKPPKGPKAQTELRDTQVAWHSKWRGSAPVVLRTLAGVESWVRQLQEAT